MTLAAGTRLGKFEIRGLLGKGGMGEVYRATDTSLKRDVALKLLPENYARDPERLGRFRREAELLAALNHPNIAAIYGVDHEGDRHYLVMELVEGETLADRLHLSRAREQAVPFGGPSAVPLDEALEITKQITAALDHAHEKTIIHRDLKPANVKVTPEGMVKVLDFGLAKAFAATPESGDPGDSPTLSAMPTLPGVILGTAAYMSPEQARGKKVDRRTDLWALGCVLYELLTGHGSDDAIAEPQPDTIQDIIARVLQADPDWSLLPANVPHGIRVLLRRCLEKDARRRYYAAADVRIQIEETLAAPDRPTPILASGTHITITRGRALLIGLGALLVGIVVAGLVTALFRPQNPPQSVVRTVITVPTNEAVGNWGCPTVALSPDGTYLAYVTTGATRRQLYLRRMDTFEARTVPGIQQLVDSPFFSPDGQWLAFWADGSLKKVATSGGTAITLTKADSFCGGSWGTGDVIIYGTVSGLMQVSVAGGSPQPVTKADAKTGETWHALPQLLPGGKSVLFTKNTSTISGTTQVVAQRLDTGESKVLVQGGNRAQYAPTGPSAGLRTGHLVYNQEGALLATPFDLDRLEVTGTPVPVVEGVLSSSFSATNTPSYIAQFSFSVPGALVYVPGSAEGALENTLVWMDRKGVVTPLPAPPRPYDDPSLAPDGQQVALEINADIWVYDISRNTLTPITHQGAGGYPLWSPDGKRVVFQAERGGPANLFWIAADGSGAEERLATSEEEQAPDSWSLDGQFLIFQQNTRDLWVLPLAGDRKARPFLQTQFGEYQGKVSPDGRWIAYSSNESGRSEVYVQPFPSPGGKRQISTEGGAEPAWARSGRELFYRNGNKMMAVDVTTTPSFSAGSPRVLFEGQFIGGSRTYDVAPDGQRFLVVRPSEQEAAATQINVVLNWFEELRRRVPAAR